MLITKFNKLIRNKILWGAFALVVCFFFVFEGLFGRSERASTPQGAGVLFGEEVPHREFFLARFFELGMRERPGLSPEANAMLRERAWKRIAALKAAERMGLAVSPEEVAEVIAMDPSFQVNGGFSRERYQAVVESQLRIDVQTFEEYVRQDILIRKLMQVMQAMVWNSPAELSRRMENITDQFRIEYAVMQPESIAGDVNVSLEDARRYYEEHNATFLEPEQMSVRYVAFPVSDHLADVDVSEAEMLAYYHDKRDDWTVPSTNATDDVLPFEEVRETIHATLTHEKAVFLARDAAIDLVMALAPGRYTAGLSMEEAAAAREMPISTTELFTAFGEVPGLAVDSDFNRSAFQLEPASVDASFSDPIVGRDAVYVIAPEQRIEPRIPEFEAVAQFALAAAEAQAQRDAAFEACEKIRQEAMAGANPFTEILAEYGVETVAPEAFTIYEGSDDLAFGEEALGRIMTLREGEFSRCIETPAGLVLVHVLERTPGDFATAQLLRPQLQSTLARYRAGILYDDWTEALLREADFKDLAIAPEDYPMADDVEW